MTNCGQPGWPRPTPNGWQAEPVAKLGEQLEHDGGMKVPLSIRAALHNLGVDAPARVLETSDPISPAEVDNLADALGNASGLVRRWGTRMTGGQYAYIAQALERIYRELDIADLIPLEREDSDA